MSASSVKNKLPVKWGFLDKEEGEKMTTLRTTVVVLLGASVLGASVQGASVPGASVPGASVPGASVPGASVPGASVLGASVLGRLLLYGPSTALQKTVEEFQCEVLHYPKEVSILYQLFREGDRSKTLGFYSALSGEMANFPLFITASCEGYMVCVASVQNNTVIQPTVSERHHLRVVDPVNGAEVVVQSGSVEFYEGKPLSLRCNITKGNHVSYQWLVDGKPLPLSPLPNQTQELFIYRMVPQDSGEYICVATNQLNFTKVYYSRSTAKVIKVRELVSELDLLFLVLKERDGTYFALVTCQSLKGTPPITFSLYSSVEPPPYRGGGCCVRLFPLPGYLGDHLLFHWSAVPMKRNTWRMREW
ncbi:uncharacterized protein LOC115184170 isoform X6 [Salmo trutta]|uniref:uncharacterized protein LOC115184170 isoform X6 n=1 Tax=Salmo trutta TaxID=8032 RepID=UPI00113055A3|nr:uncharacterized protein LOC115184170 isoform X6 [Salmo trutta]